MRTVVLLTAAAIALCACETAPGRAPARIAEHHPTGAETAQRGTAMQVSLDKVSNPEGRLAHASVQDKNGTKVGTVRKVFVDANRIRIAAQNIARYRGLLKHEKDQRRYKLLEGLIADEYQKLKRAPSS